MLKPRKRLTKKELKEDKLVTIYMQAQRWLEEYSKYIIGGIAAILIIVLIGVFYSNSLKTAEMESSSTLSQATNAYERGDYETAASILSNLVDQSGNTRSGKLARLYLANSLFQTGKYYEAEEQYRKFAGKFRGDEHILSAAAAGIAACMEQRQEYESAARQYEKVAKKYKGSIFAPRYLLRAARCYQLAEKTNLAKQTYSRLIEEYPESTEKEEAQLLSALL